MGHHGVVLQWDRSEQFGCHGVLVYTDNGVFDPWIVAQIVIESTDRLVPLVYDQLRMLADNMLKREQPGVTLQGLVGTTRPVGC